MEIKSIRKMKGKNTTLSFLTVDGVAQQYILEDVDRGLYQGMQIDEIRLIKIPERTAIPVGRYRVDITYSSRFKRMMLILIGVPGFSGIRVHGGNTHLNTEGCLLPGKKYDIEKGDYIVRTSRIAADALQSQVAAVLAKDEKVWWTIEQKYE